VKEGKGIGTEFGRLPRVRRIGWGVVERYAKKKIQVILEKGSGGGGGGGGGGVGVRGVGEVGEMFKKRQKLL